MGQYFLIANTDKKEFIHPHTLGSGLGAGQIIDDAGALKALGLLLLKSDCRMIQSIKSTVPGSWAGDHIVIIGDEDSSRFFNEVEKTYKDISLECRSILETAGFKLTQRWDL